MLGITESQVTNTEVAEYELIYLILSYSKEILMTGIYTLKSVFQTLFQT